MMKLFLSRIIPLVGLAVLLLGTACEYDVTEPGWYDEFENPPEPIISAMEPATATAGYNFIKIIGENFAAGEGDNRVYFGSVAVDVLEFSTTSLTVRRPNIAGDSITVKVSSADALVVAKYNPYKIDRVYEPFGEFIENQQLNAVAVDKSGNVYICQNSPRTVYKITPDGDKTALGETSRIVKDAKISPKGKLLLLMNNNTISQMDTETGEETDWANAGKRVSCGDFDADGYFYAAGRRTGVVAIAPDLSVNKINAYANNEILNLRVYDGYLYLIVSGGDPELAIWRHQLINGTLGDQELVLDWAESGEFAESTPNSLAFSTDGTMYVATSYDSPIMTVEPDGTRDIMYKDILPTTAEHVHWGTGSYLYMISGGSEWKLYRIDMGEEGAPYYGLK